MRRRRVQAKPITLAQAKSYQRTTPNGLGVTAIAHLNGRGAYRSRYRQARALLGQQAGQSTKGSGMKRGLKRNLSKAGKSRLVKAQRRRGRSARQASAFAKMLSRQDTWRKSKGYVNNKSTKRRRPASKLKSRRRKVARKPNTHPRYRPLKVRLGGRTRYTYTYLTKKRRVRHIPVHGQLGYASPRGMRGRWAKSPKRRAKDEKRIASIKRRRERASIAVVSRGGVFTPNRRRRKSAKRIRTLTFAEWERRLKSNRRRRRRPQEESMKTSAGRRRKRRRVARRRGPVRRATTTRRKRKKASVKRVVRRKRRKSAAPKRRRRRVRMVANRRRRTRRSAPVVRRRRRRARRSYAMNPRRRRRYAVKLRSSKKSRRRSRRFTPNRRRFSLRGGYRRNVSAIFSDVKTVLKVGGIVVGGLVLQKTATRFLSRIPLLQQYAGSWTASAAGLLSALGTMFLIGKFGSKLPVDKTTLKAGVAAGFVHTLAVDVLMATGQTQALEYLSGVDDAQASALRQMGEYYSPGMGSYYQLQGFGADCGPMAAACDGFGACPDVSAAACDGFGGPCITQAAAGVGEYFVSGGQAVGDYEEVAPEYSPSYVEDEGIMPTLDSAERALSIAEAAAGVGAFGQAQMAASPSIDSRSIVYPVMRGATVAEGPAGARSGTFAGQNGIFGA